MSTDDYEMPEVFEDDRETFERDQLAQDNEDAPESCANCGAPEGDCDCCPECNGEGYFEDGGCGGGCDFCQPFPRCNRCRGTGKVRR